MEKQISGHSEPSEGPVDKEDGSLLKKENGKSVEAGAQAQSAPAAPAGAVNGGAAGGVGPPADILLLDHLPARDQWSTKVDFLLSCVGFAVGLGNVWRFPYLCYKNGGGAFLIPYLICLVCGGMPVFFMEIALGQYTARGGLAAWKICPAFQGIGIATTVIVFLMNIYYIVILAWDLYYASMAFQNPLPWSHCNNPWNTDRCMVSSAAINCTHILASESSPSNTSLASNITQEYISPAARLLCESRAGAADNATLLGNVTANVTAKVITTVDPVVEFWENKILQISSGIDEPGGIVWQLALSLFIVWLCCYFCVWKGVKWTGKIVYFTATFPYVMLTILLVRGVTLEGAWDGLEFYLKPDFSRLGDAQVWIDGGTQIFFSYAIALGIITALGSYNKFHNNCYKDAVVVACINSFTSLYAGVVVFSVLGFMAHEQGVSIHDVAESGPGLAFIAYPKAVTQMPMSPLWAVMFFFMIILIGVDSQFVGVEGFVTVFMDLFPSLRKGYNKEIFIACYCIVSFLIGLTMVTNGGMYVFQIFDYYAASGMSLLWVCFFECVAIAWVYGGENFYDNIETMIGFRINCWFRICWTYITPTITMGILVFMLVSFKPLTYNQTYEYPLWAQGLGMSMAFSSMLCIPAFFVLKLLTTKGDTLAQRWQKMSSPTSQMLLELKRNIWLSRNDTPSSSGTPDDSVTPDKGGTPESGKKLWSGGSGTPQHHAATGVRQEEKVPLHDTASPV